MRVVLDRVFARRSRAGIVSEVWTCQTRPVRAASLRTPEQHPGHQSCSVLYGLHYTRTFDVLPVRLLPLDTLPFLLETTSARPSKRDETRQGEGGVNVP